ncbi:MAG: hypothetical protein ACXWH7_01295 [Thermoanaerobaculia bacterium]
MRKSTKWMLAGASAGAAAAATAAYGLIARPWHLRWGATREELTAPMPFDGLIPDANYFATRAITIEATPDLVWPFVIDLSVLPAGTIIRRAEEKQSVVFAPPEVEAEATWVVVLEPRGNATRLVSRNRARFPGRLRAVMRYLLVDPGQFLFERDWMLNVKARAEERAEVGESKSAAAASCPGGDTPESQRQLDAAAYQSGGSPPPHRLATALLEDEVQVSELVP